MKTKSSDIRSFFLGANKVKKDKETKDTKPEDETQLTKLKSTPSKSSDKGNKKLSKVIHIQSDSDDGEDFNCNKSPSKAKRTSGRSEKSTPKKRLSKRKSSEHKNVSSKTSLDSEEEVEEEVVKGKRNRGKKKRTFDSDSDDANCSPSKAKSRKKPKRVLAEDSDEEITPRKSTLDSFFKSPSPSKVNSQKKTQRDDREAKKETVVPSDFFGGGSVKRSERSTLASKRKLDDDVNVHDDKEFEETLEMLEDEPKTKKVKTENTSGTSIASKLASKAKGSSLVSNKEDNISFLPETPAHKQKSPVKKNSPVKFSPKKSPGTSETATTPKKESPDVSEKAKMTNKSSEKTSPNKKKPSPAKSDGSPDKPSLVSKTSYRSYLTREGPKALGTKEIPEGADNCLEGLTFVITGVLDAFDRDDMKHAIEKYGGKVTGSVSKKTNYLVAGRDSGESKLNKAKSLGTKIIDEDEVLRLIKEKPGKKSKYEIKAEEELKKEKAKEKLESLKTLKSETSIKKEEPSACSSRQISDPSSDVSSQSKKQAWAHTPESLMWVDKYKPTSIKQIIGQQGDKSNAKKLLHWLTSWHSNRDAGAKPQGKFFGRDDGAGFRAALLSGPPGIGKTTTATLVCQEAGFSFVELNASDTRSKKSLQTEVAEALGNETLVDFMGTKQKSKGRMHCLLMDEVDGMAGNEDRGGLQELVNLIKNTKIPIVCMCNDRNHPKMRTLSNYCFDLRFQRPRMEQIKAAMMSLAFKEGIKIPPPALNEIIMASNQDIRQVIHNLSMWTATDKTVTFDQAKKDSNSAKKDMKMGPFDVCRKVFVGGEETAGMTLFDKSDLFFQDYSFGPLFVHENYINVIPYGAKGNQTRHMSLLARSAESICDGDLVDRRIRSSNSWSLLPLQAFSSSVIPGEYMRGSFPQMVSFPAWLGKNSSTNKNDRILQELRTHMRLQISGDKRSLNMDYLPYLKNALADPLVKMEAEGVPDVIKVMDDYDIIKEDYDNIMEVTKWPNTIDRLKDLSSKTKAAFTRAYNKEVHMTPYSTGTLSKKKRGGGGGGAVEDLDMMDEEGKIANQDSDAEEDDSIENDTMIKAKKKAATSKSKDASATDSSKGKGKGKGRGKKK